MNPFALAWMFLRGGGRRGLLGSSLVFGAVATTAALLMFTVAMNTAFAERAERISWRAPQAAAEAEAVALQAVSLDHAAGQRIVLVQVAALDGANPPAPPGLEDFPLPGEAYVSPALAELLRELPPEQLADRYPGPPVGELGPEALAHDEELAIVVGRSPQDPALTAPFAFPNQAATPISDFGGRTPDEYLLYQALAALATVLLTVPLLVFGGAAARLTVARRDQRLAALRLIGATPGQVLRLTVAEAVVTAAIGAAAGVGLYFAAAPALTQISIDGGAWRLSDLLPSPLWTAGVLLAASLLTGVSAVLGLRRVVVSPLGVARRHTPPGLRAARLLLLLVLVAAFFSVAAGLFGDFGGLGAAILLALLGGVFGALNYVGPWAASLLGRCVVAVSRSAATLLAGRRLIDDPRSAWRTVAGVAMTGFLAGFFALLPPGDPSHADSGADTFTVAAPQERAEAIVAAAAESFEAPEISQAETEDGMAVLTVAADRGSEAADRFRTVLAETAPEAAVTSVLDSQSSDAVFTADLNTGVLTVLAASLLLAMVSAAITGAASVLDRRQNYALLRLSGAPLRVLNAARRKETAIPLLVMGGGSLAVGMLMATPFMNELGINPKGAALLGGVLGVGFLGVIGASALSRPLLRSATTDPAPRPD